MEISFGPKFINSANKLGSSDSFRIWQAVEKYSKDSNASGLNFERLTGQSGKKKHLCTIRASRDLRILLSCEGQTSVLLLAGHHDDIYNFANQADFTVPRFGVPRFISNKSETLDIEGFLLEETPSMSKDGSQSSILEHWNDKDLARMGFSQDQIKLLRLVPQDAQNLFKVWPDMDDELFDRIVECIEHSPEDLLQQKLFDNDEAREKQFRKVVVERGALAGLSSLLTPQEFKRLIAAPIEDWMIFLHPDQHILVNRYFKGPVRVRGAAGTGKTVVALHRAASLAKRFADESSTSSNRFPKVLFTTFISSLPPVFEGLYLRLPNNIKEAVSFINVDKVAYDICRRAGQRPNLDPVLVDKAFKDAFDSVIRPNTLLSHMGLTRSYLRDEVTKVIKGRGIDSFEEYKKIERTGRKTPLTEPVRKQVWELHQEWNRRLAEAGVEDYPDVILRARDLVRDYPEPRYRAAIVDESQDLTLAGLQLIRALVNGADGQDKPDALFIVGDGAQKIYPGGFTLSQAGINIRGNSFVLRVNYRNTREIIEAAMACTGSELVDDFGEEYARGDADVATVRGGIMPCLVQAGKFDAQIKYVVEQVKRLRETDDLGLGDIGVFAYSNFLVKRAGEYFEEAGLANQPLADFKGRPNNLIKIGTFHRVKGLEFKIVFLLDISAGSFPRDQFPGQLNAEYREQRALDINQLFVAMTRARDGLFVLYDGNPSDALIEGVEHFDEIRLQV